MLIFEIFFLDIITIILPSTPSGFKANDKLKDSWIKEFIILLPPYLPYASKHCIALPDLTGTPSGHESGVYKSLDKSLNLFN
jgi:hypothetical protein